MVETPAASQKGNLNVLALYQGISVYSFSAFFVLFSRPTESN
jgi:hypothetical protein